MLVTQEFTIKIGNKTLLDDMHLTYGPGVHVIMGPNGVGKSSFAHALMGHPHYTTLGAVEYNGKDLLSMQTHERAQAGLFVSFQNPVPIEGLSNFQLMRQVLHKKSLSTITDSLKTFKDIANEYKLPEQWDKRTLNVEASGGEKKKNELIQLEMINPQTAILDEPDSGLDIDAIKILTEKLKQFAEQEDKCLIVISHYRELIEDLDPTSVTIFGRKRVVQQDGASLAHKVLDNGFDGY